MSLILVILLLAVILIILTFFVKAKVTLFSNINEAVINASLLWLDRFFKAEFIYENLQPTLTIYLFNKIVYERHLKKKEVKANRHKLRKLDILKSLSLSDVDIQTSYGFDNPFSTGITCGLLGIITQFINIDTFEQNPYFTPDDDFIYLNATANINIGLTGINLIRAYTRSSTNKLTFETGRGG